MSRSIGGAKRGTSAESPLPLIDPHGGDNPSVQHPVLHPKPLHPGTGTEIEIEHSDNDNGDVTSDNDTTDSNEGLSEGDIDELDDTTMQLEEQILVTAENTDENDIDEETMSLDNDVENSLRYEENDLDRLGAHGSSQKSVSNIIGSEHKYEDDEALIRQLLKDKSTDTRPWCSAFGDGSSDRFGLSPDWFEKVQAALHKKKEDKVKSSKKKNALSTDNVLEHIHARFSELAASTLAAANAAVTNEIEARAIVKSEKKVEKKFKVPLPVSESASNIDRMEPSRVTKDSKHPIKYTMSEDRLPVVKRITAAMNRLTQESNARKEEKKPPVKMSYSPEEKVTEKKNEIPIDDSLSSTLEEVSLSDTSFDSTQDTAPVQPFNSSVSLTIKNSNEDNNGNKKKKENVDKTSSGGSKDLGLPWSYSFLSKTSNTDKDKKDTPSTTVSATTSKTLVETNIDSEDEADNTRDNSNKESKPDGGDDSSLV